MQDQFHGLPTEDPMYHLDTFEDICATFRVNGIPDEVIKRYLFTFSLSDIARRWLKLLDPKSVQTWDVCKAAFLRRYYPLAQTIRLRNEILGFKQSREESFYEAWERYKSYSIECPHHGFSQPCLLITFYRGINERYRWALDAASDGDFATNTEGEALIKIENLARSIRDNYQDEEAEEKISEIERLKERFAKMELQMKESRSVDPFDEQNMKKSEEEAGINMREFKEHQRSGSQGVSGSEYQPSEFPENGESLRIKELKESVRQSAEELRKDINHLRKKQEKALKVIDNNLEKASVKLMVIDALSTKQKLRQAVTLRRGRELHPRKLQETNNNGQAEKRCSWGKARLRDPRNSQRRVTTGRRRGPNCQKPEVRPFIPKIPFPERPKHLQIAKNRDKFAGIIKQLKCNAALNGIHDERKDLGSFVSPCKKGSLNELAAAVNTEDQTIETAVRSDSCNPTEEATTSSTNAQRTEKVMELVQPNQLEGTNDSLLEIYDSEDIDLSCNYQTPSRTPTRTPCALVCEPPDMNSHVEVPMIDENEVDQLEDNSFVPRIEHFILSTIMAALSWKTVCLFAHIVCCVNRRRTKGPLAQPFDSCD